ncbi:MAG: lysophospholipase [Treponemataceae bacterium]
MKKTTVWIKADDGVNLFSRRWVPDEASFPVPRALVQIVHGMGEHSARYEGVAERLCASGYEVWADDHRGHGETARGGILGHTADTDGFFRVVRDLSRWSDEIIALRPCVPLFLVGHSWGSFLAQAYIEKQGSRLSGCVLSGTRGPGGPEVLIGSILSSIVAGLFGSRRHSAFLKNLADGKLNTQFMPNRTEFDWLSRDEKVVDAYVADPLCGFHLSAGFYRDLTSGFQSIHRQSSISRIPKQLPIYVVSGALDPVGLNGKSPSALVAAYRAAGIVDLEFVLYPDARHEIFNETNRDEVLGALVSWLDRHTKPAA